MNAQHQDEAVLPACGQRHWTPGEIAAAWRLNERTIRDLFRDEPGVLKIGETGRRGRRDYLTLRVPEVVLQRVYQRRCK